MTSHLASSLWRARTKGGRVAVQDCERPSDEAGAYAVQSEVSALFESEIVAWKLGATNQKTLDLLGFERPFAGPLLAKHFHDPQRPLGIYAEHGPALETEFLVALGADLPARDAPYGDAEVAEVVEYVCPAFEIVACRVEDGFAAAGLLLIADGAANVAVIQGEPTREWRSANLSDHPLAVEVNGVEVATGSSNMLMWGNPFGAVAYLAAHPLVAGRGLRKGERIMTGTCAGLLPITSGDRASADFGVLGSVRVEIA